MDIEIEEHPTVVKDGITYQTFQLHVICCEGCDANGVAEFGWQVPEGEPVITPIDLWGKFDPPSLPLGVLPKTIEQYATVQGELMGVDPGGLAVAALTVCAAAIPDSIKLQVKRHNRGWLESARLWTGLIGPPSAKKTPIMKEASWPLVQLDVQYAREYATHKAGYDELEPEQRRGRPAPRRKQLKIEDTTVEGAQEVLRDNPQGVLCLRDELGGWFGQMDKYNGGRAGQMDRGFWLQSWNGGPYSVDRIKRGSSLLENLSISILGGIQPDVIRTCVAEAHDDGLIQRMFPIVLRTGALGQDVPITDEADEYVDLIKRLHELKPTFITGWDNLRGDADRLVFDDEAQAVRQRLEGKHLELMGLETINKKLAAHVGKYDSFFARLCVTFHCIENAAGRLPCTVTEDTAERVAKFLHEFLLPHALAFYGGVLGMSDDHDRLTAVAGYVLAHGLETLTNRDIQRGDRTMRKLTRWDTERLCEQLEALGWLIRKDAPRRTDPPHWQVNPEVHQLFAEKAKQEAERRAAVQELIKEASAVRRAERSEGDEW
jgi:hypothetical protein